MQSGMNILRAPAIAMIALLFAASVSAASVERNIDKSGAESATGAPPVSGGRSLSHRIVSARRPAATPIAKGCDIGERMREGY